MKWFSKKPKTMYEIVDRFSGKYSFTVMHNVLQLTNKLVYKEYGFHTDTQANERAEEVLKEMYTRGIRYYSKYFPPHRINSSEIMIYYDGIKIDYTPSNKNYKDQGDINE